MDRTGTDTFLNSFWAELSDEMGVEVPFSVALKASKDESYCYHLLAVRSSPECVQKLFALAETASSSLNSVPSTAELVKKLGTSVFRWSRNGFQTSDETTFKRRWEACQACPHLAAPPERLFYYLGRKILGSEKKDNYICSLCGCYAKTKASISTELCPSPNPLNKRLSRWEETILKETKYE